MLHKSNPVLAELLVTLARFNATQVSILHHSLVHEQERSGAAWMLEWMVLTPDGRGNRECNFGGKRLMPKDQMWGAKVKKRVISGNKMETKKWKTSTATSHCW